MSVISDDLLFTFRERNLNEMFQNNADVNVMNPDFIVFLHPFASSILNVLNEFNSSCNIIHFIYYTLHIKNKRIKFSLLFLYLKFEYFSIFHLTTKSQNIITATKTILMRQQVICLTVWSLGEFQNVVPIVINLRFFRRKNLCGHIWFCTLDYL